MELSTRWARPSKFTATLPAPFVADFIGSMNFLPVQVTGKDRVLLGKLELEVNGGMRGFDKMSRVTVCVRPEDVVVLDVKKSTPNSFDAEITSMEFLGAFYRASLASTQIGAAELRADISVNMVRHVGVEKGKKLKVALPKNRLRVFTETRPGR